jgi:hypothetical protein
MRIRHTVIFTFKHSKSPKEVQEFLEAARKLAVIPGVEKFECLKQISPKNKFEFGLSMEFANRGLYEAYNAHPEHTAFVQERWLTEVEDFMEIDYELI